MLRLAVICDPNALRPTALAVESALSHATGPVELIVVGLDFAASDWARLDRMVASFPQTILTRIDFDISQLGDAGAVSAHISRATFARLFLHRLVDGVVLYMDGDVLVTGDLSRLKPQALAGQPIAAVPDFVVQKWCARRNGFRRRTALQKLRRWAEYSGDPARYFNAGVILMDMPAIRADAGLVAALEDVATASGYPLGDQDHLNRVFQNRATLIDPAWNCSWGRLHRQRSLMAKAGLPMAPPSDLAIIHYHGPNKPWKKLGWRKNWPRWPQIQRYRRALRAFNARYLDLAF
ncbi:glycosyltransferase family 8 protein [Paracoccus pacificus]|uniref:Glycosyltransferase family 8 protein n=1 Tax=Paracoccus pacificus TaxID=1463598 RepID=A0ABW4R2X3_9RHOB